MSVTNVTSNKNLSSILRKRLSFLVLLELIEIVKLTDPALSKGVIGLQSVFDVELLLNLKECSCCYWFWDRANSDDVVELSLNGIHFMLGMKLLKMKCNEHFLPSGWYRRLSWFINNLTKVKGNKETWNHFRIGK